MVKKKYIYMYISVLLIEMEKSDFMLVFKVLTDERMQNAISETTSEVLSEAPDADHTEETYKKILKAQTRKARQVVIDMHSAMSNLMLKYVLLFF